MLMQKELTPSFEIALESRSVIWMTDTLEDLLIRLLISSLVRFIVKMDSFGTQKFEPKRMVSYGYPRYFILD